MRRIGPAVVMFVIAATSVSAQQLRARIVDDVSRQPIVGVDVRVIDNADVEIAAETGADGFFAIEHIEPGSYTLLIEHPGYAPVRQPLDSTGVLVTRFGGRGDGPGELQTVRAVHVCDGDSVIAVNGPYLDTFNDQGDFIRRVRSRRPGQPAQIHAISSDLCSCFSGGVCKHPS